MLNIANLVKLFPLPTLPEIPHRYDGRVDGVSRPVKSVSVAKELTADLTFDITVTYIPGPVIVGTYHALTNKPEIVTVDGKDVDMEKVHFHSGYRFPQGPWVGFEFDWSDKDSTGATAFHRADVRAWFSPEVLLGL